MPQLADGEAPRIYGVGERAFHRKRRAFDLRGDELGGEQRPRRAARSVGERGVSAGKARQVDESSPAQRVGVGARGGKIDQRADVGMRSRAWRIPTPPTCAMSRRRCCQQHAPGAIELSA